MEWNEELIKVTGGSDAGLTLSASEWGESSSLSTDGRILESVAFYFPLSLRRFHPGSFFSFFLISFLIYEMNLR